MTNALDSAFVYNDLAGLNSIKQSSRGDSSDQALRAVAQQFESMFMQQIMQSMDQANKSLNPDSMFNSFESESWQDMHRQQFSLSMSQKGGMGLADVLYEQMKAQQPEAHRSEGPVNIKSLAESGRPIVAALLRREQPESANEVVSGIVDRMKSGFSHANDKQNFNTPGDFIESLYPYAKKAAAVLGVDPKYLLAQAALETGWGQKQITHADGTTSFNLFGIKANSGWQGEQAKIVTHEFMQGKKVKIHDEFRSYRNWQHSFDDYVDFIKQQPRYQQALSVVDDAKAYYQELQRAGYATDPEYAEKISKVANSSTMLAVLKNMGEVS